MTRSFYEDLDSIILQAERDYSPDDPECMRSMKRAIRADEILYEYFTRAEAALDRVIATRRDQLHAKERAKTSAAARQQKREAYRAASPAVPRKSPGGRRDRAATQVLEFANFLAMTWDNRRLADWMSDELRKYAEIMIKRGTTTVTHGHNLVAIADLAEQNAGGVTKIGKAVKNGDIHAIWCGEMPETPRKGKKAA